jgi:uncharacterized protein (DUF362 family)/Pyruvate/2-oxoacid:ferredoxin oxidoreductase delta subunit
MSTVALAGCGTYDGAEVRAAVKRGLDLLGGAGRFARHGEKILLKVNLLSGEPPEKCVTTHPAVLTAAGELFRQAGARVSWGDSPAFGSTLSAARRAGMTVPAQEAGMELADFSNGGPVSFAEGKQNRNFVIARAVLDSDGVISLPKLKTHAFLKFTGCIKNQFGCVPGILKAEYHVKLPNADDFAKMLVDLDRLVRPRLYIMDAVHAMEGNGPHSGTPRRLGLLAFSEDPVALDATVCRLLGVDPALVPTTRYGQDAGRGTYERENIALVGDPFDSFKTGEFAIDRSPVRPYHRARRLLNLLNPFVLPKPVIDKRRCTRCGRCVRICPVAPKAVDWTAGGRSQPPAHDYARCIRCFCCQEVCPSKAIRVKKPLLRNLLIRRH